MAVQGGVEEVSAIGRRSGFFYGQCDDWLLDRGIASCINIPGSTFQDI